MVKLLDNHDNLNTRLLQAIIIFLIQDYEADFHSGFLGWLSKESQPQNPEFNINPENFTYDLGIYPFPSSHDLCHLLFHLLMFLGSIYCKQSGFIVFVSITKSSLQCTWIYAAGVKEDIFRTKKNVFFLSWLVGLRLYIPVNSYGHVKTVS